MKIKRFQKPEIKIIDKVSLTKKTFGNIFSPKCKKIKRGNYK